MNRTTVVSRMKDMFSAKIMEKYDHLNRQQDRIETLKEYLKDKTLPYSTYKSYEMELEGINDVIRFLDWDIKSWIAARENVYQLMAEMDMPITIQIHPNNLVG